MEHKFTLTDEERAQLEKLAQAAPNNIKKIANGLKGEARDKYLIALRSRKR